jgi:hypothetical protein
MMIVVISPTYSLSPILLPHDQFLHLRCQRSRRVEQNPDNNDIVFGNRQAATVRRGEVCPHLIPAK